MQKYLTLIFICVFSPLSFAQEIAILKYDGGGDWYSNPTALPNLIEFCNNTIKTKIETQPKTVEAESVEIFNYPIV
ncbi:MAG: DUF4159 domain-containing protein, partial [Flavobacteriaceae bacterium]|nr:DUF4159 domain-containing protein [Flavobacteriaceae bacterium]